MNEKPKTVACPKCHAEIGTVVTVESLDFLHIKNTRLLVRYLHSVCLDCNSEFIWNVNDRLLATLAKSIADRM